MLKFFDKIPKYFGRFIKYIYFIIVVKGEKIMSLGNKILELRKKQGLSQEQLGEKVDVTRQTISNWELGETSPNPEQLKLLSKALKISIDELLDNDDNNVLIERVSNTERLAGIIIKILKFIGIAFIVFFIIDLIALITYTSNGRLTTVESRANAICKIEDKKYEIELRTDKYFKCENCSDNMKKDIQELIHFNDIDDSMRNIEKYFESNNGICE